MAWSYKLPTDRFAAIAGYLAFYPSRVDACFVDDEQVAAQDGDFYGGWSSQQDCRPLQGCSWNVRMVVVSSIRSLQDVASIRFDIYSDQQEIG